LSDQNGQIPAGRELYSVRMIVARHGPSLLTQQGLWLPDCRNI
jgi:hypothetical protein